MTLQHLSSGVGNGSSIRRIISFAFHVDAVAEAVGHRAQEHRRGIDATRARDRRGALSMPRTNGSSIARGSTRIIMSSTLAKRTLRSRSMRNVAGIAMPPFSFALSTPHSMIVARSLSESSGNGIDESLRRPAERSGGSTEIADDLGAGGAEIIVELRIVRQLAEAERSPMSAIEDHHAQRIFGQLREPARRRRWYRARKNPARCRRQ